MFKLLIRISSFLGKELIEIFRQPRLILTLVLGPFLIMFMFGLAYPERSRALRTTFVASNSNAFQDEMKLFTESYKAAIIDMGVETDKEAALAQLHDNQTDLVIVIPDTPAEAIQNNEHAQLEIYHNEVDPIQIEYIKTIAQIYINVVNRQVLENVVEQGQVDSDTLQTDLESAITKTQELRKTISPADVNIVQQAAELEKDLTTVHDNLVTFRSLTSAIVVNPFAGETSPLSGIEFSVPEFFAASVIALLLQHLSITFACLSIVRERRSGIMELFRIAPLTAFEMLTGKYISYLLFETILAGAITALAVSVLHVPMLGQWQDYAVAVGILLFTSLGVGFFISLISQTDTQAVQYAMLLLLASIFFSGFLLDLRLINAPITIVTWSLPATYGIRMLQDVMLRGTPITVQILQGIAMIGIVLFLVDWLLLRRKMDN